MLRITGAVVWLNDQSRLSTKIGAAKVSPDILNIQDCCQINEDIRVTNKNCDRFSSFEL